MPCLLSPSHTALTNPRTLPPRAVTDAYSSVSNLVVGGRSVGASYDYYGNKNAAFKITSLLNSNITTSGVVISFDLPSPMQLHDLIIAPLFAAFPLDQTLCPLGMISGMPSQT